MSKPTEYVERSTYLDATDERFTNSIEELAQGLIDLADRIKKEGHSPLAAMDIERFTAYSSQANAVGHSLTWGIANLPLNRVFRDAIEADYAARLAHDEAKA